MMYTNQEIPRCLGIRTVGQDIGEPCTRYAARKYNGYCSYHIDQMITQVINSEFALYDELIKDNIHIIELERQIDITMGCNIIADKFGYTEQWGYTDKRLCTYYVERLGCVRYVTDLTDSCKRSRMNLLRLVKGPHYHWKRLNRIQILERYEFFLKCHRSYWPNGEDPYVLLRKIYRVINSYSRYRIDLESLCQEAFKPSRVMYQLSLDPNYYDD